VWDVVYYARRSGRQPAEEFEDHIPSSLSGKLTRATVEAARNGFSVGGGLLKNCRGYPGLFEVRAIWSNQLARFFCHVDGNRLVLLHGLAKRPGDETPKMELDKAYKCLADYKATKKTSPEKEDVA